MLLLFFMSMFRPEIWDQAVIPVEKKVYTNILFSLNMKNGISRTPLN